MATIAALVGEMFEDAEFAQPASAFRDAGNTVTTIGLNQGENLLGKRGKETVEIERAVQDITVDDFDALFIPGGCSPDHLRGYAAPVRFVRDFVESGKPVFAICHGPQIFITADVVNGRIMTSWRTVQIDLWNAGADVRDEPVIVDRNIVTSRQPSDIPAFIDASLQMLQRPVEVAQA